MSEFGPTTHYQNGQVVELGNNLPVPIEAALPAVAVEQVGMVEMRTLTPDGAAQFSQALRERLSGIDVMHATEKQSLDAMAGASIATELLSEALSADPDAYEAVSGYRGPIDMMAHSAQRMHTHQTGHPFHEASFFSGSTDYNKALSILGVVKGKVEDRRWDGTHGRGNADATTASARQMVASSAAQGLELIAQQRGVAQMSAATVAKITEFLGTRK